MLCLCAQATVSAEVPRIQVSQPLANSCKSKCTHSASLSETGSRCYGLQGRREAGWTIENAYHRQRETGLFPVPQRRKFCHRLETDSDLLFSG